ncbi:unnamed protein product [Ectocarpus sp. 8 AP-2014]
MNYSVSQCSKSTLVLSFFSWGLRRFCHCCRHLRVIIRSLVAKHHDHAARSTASCKPRRLQGFPFPAVGDRRYHTPGTGFPTSISLQAVLYGTEAWRTDSLITA